MPNHSLPDLLPGKAVLAILVLAAISVVVRVGAAAEYFVSRSGDNTDGLSEKTAFSSVGKAIAMLKPGDVLTILPGEYFEAVSARISGDPQAPITIRAERPGTVLLRGDVDAPRFHRAQGLQYTYRADFTPRVEGVVERSTRRIYEPMLSLAEVELAPASFYQDSQAARLYVHTSDSAPPDRHALTVSVTNGFGLLLTPPPGSATVHDLVIDGLSFTGYHAREFPPEPGSRNRWGLHVVMGERVAIRRSAAFLNIGGIFLLAPADSIVEDCCAFGNRSRFLDLGNNILGWSVSDTTFHRNTVESFWKSGASTDDITFYGGERYDKKPARGVMQANLAIHAGLMIKGAFGTDTQQTQNIVIGRGAYFYRPPDATNLLLPQHESPQARQIYADPLNFDFRLQSDAPLRGQSDGKDPGPYPYRDEVFFVSPTGDDSAAGTSLRKPWRTLSHAARCAGPGHTVYITAGEYAESLAPANSGTADQPIRFLRHGRDRVVLDGQDRIPLGVDLSGREHIEVGGLLVHRFTQCGVAANQGSDLKVRQVLIIGSGGDGARFSSVAGLVFDHNLLRDNRTAGLFLENCSQAAVTGNVFDLGGPSLICDAATLESLWSDCNAFASGGKQEALVAAADRSFTSLPAWQQAAGMDPTSIASEIGYRHPDPERCDFALGPESPLPGRGPHASVIGPFLRLAVKTPVAVENVRVHQLTDTTAAIQWWTPKTAVAGMLHYGETPDCPNTVETPPGSFHTAGLVGLKPGTKYFFRAAGPGMAEELRFAPYEVNAQTQPETSTTDPPGTFATPSQRPAPRTFHVAPTGDDARSGLSATDAWRSVAHAAGQVRAGDTVLIHAGTYEEYVLVRATGDEQSPIAFRAAPGETVWMEGSDRFRTTAFHLVATHHVHIDGIRFRHFRYAPHSGDVINIFGGSDNVVRRCFHDGRETSGYVGNFIRASGTRRLSVENCVMINGMGEGVTLYNCPDVSVRNCVFYNNFIRALSAWNFEPDAIVALSHNLFCDTIPEKTGNAFIRLNHLENLRSDHNAYFARKGPAERRLVETAKIGGKAVGYQAPGTYRGADLLLADVQRQAGQEAASVFGNPGIRVARELLPPGAPESQWRKTEMHWDGRTFQPWDFTDFLADPAGPLARAADGKPVGLDPAAFP
ncbi:MAG: right-handed parallel beta-helix repeat-containing protein [Pirellulales bacterium]|nr:right-handed parallel beta-helix repeat-containing protein [Pirellulales bacterium]